MTNVPFIVVCTSCESVLEVRNPELVGQIVACPKCGSMVLIEPTNQSRQSASQPVAHAPISELPAPTPVTSATHDATHSEIISEFQHKNDAKTVGTTVAANDNVSGDANADATPVRDADVERLGPLAAELQAKFLSGETFDDWHNRRLVIVAVGTACLLLTFFAFLLFRPHPENIASPGQSPEHRQPAIGSPLPPDGIETTRTGGQSIEESESDAIQQGESPSPSSLPPADEIKVEGQPGTPGNQPDATNQQADASEPAPESKPESKSPGPLRPPTDTSGQGRTAAGQSGAAVRVTLPNDEPLNDPFGEIFDRVNNDNGANEQASPELPEAESRREAVAESDGFSGIIGNEEPPEKNAVDKPDESVTENGEVAQSEIRIEPGDKQEPVEPKSPDISERLALSITSFRVEKAPVVDVVRALSDLSGVPMQLDIDELRARGISVESPISLQMRETTVAGIIDAVLQKTRLTRRDVDGCLVFGYTDEQVNAARTVRYDLSKLASLEQNPISAEQAAKWLAELLINQPQNPKVRNATAAVDGNEIVVVGTIWLQDQAKRLLLSLYYLRGLEPESGLSPERLAPEVFGWDRVNTPLSFNLVEPMPLKQAVRLIEGHTKLRVLIDHAALLEEGLSRESTVISHVSNGTVDTVFRGMLEPLGLTYRIVEANAIEITTPRVAREKMTIEAQQYAPLPTGKTPESCAETIRQAFGGDASWNPETGGVIVIDPVSGYMLVRQSQPLQRDIRLWFGRMHNEPGRADAVDAEVNDADATER